MKVYRFADINISWSCGEYIFEPDERVDLFRIDDNSEADIIFTIREMGQNTFAEAECLRKTGSYELLRTPKGLFLMNHWATCRFGYGVWLDDIYSEDNIPVCFNSKMYDQIPLNIVRFMGTTGLHSVLLMRDAPIIHASYIDYKGAAILFTGVSGTGKSTQAELWKKVAGADIINGDRVLLREKNQLWHAYGYPSCGSSRICVNRTLPIAAIVVLEQGSENKVEEIPVVQKMRALVSATEVYLWEQREIEKAFELAEKIVSKVPVIKLTCCPNDEAVETLKQYLEEKNHV